MGIAPSAGKPGGPQAGPYGHTDKGTYFEDSHFSGFPDKIEMVYQGFVWAMTVYYPDQDSLLHGGTHHPGGQGEEGDVESGRGLYYTRVWSCESLQYQPLDILHRKRQEIRTMGRPTQ